MKITDEIVRSAFSFLNDYNDLLGVARSNYDIQNEIKPQ